MSRKLEATIGLVGAILVLFFLGGFAVTIFTVNMMEFKTVIAPVFEGAIPGINSASGFENMKTLGAWFSITAFLTLILTALGNFFISGNKAPKKAALSYLISGLLVLFGSQFIAYPLAFIFFIAASFSIFRKKK